MKTRLDAELTADADRFAFRFACDDCAHFAERRRLDGVSEGRCGNGWPIGLRRSALNEPSESGIWFCKEFELA